MAKSDDLVASAKTVLARYKSGKMDRETVREWVLRLGAYPEPYGSRVRAADDWFRAHPLSDVSGDIEEVDFEMLQAIIA
ncbi:hypothetical protein [Rhizobium sp. BK376]|uniref:hypothetical protein n=1 Tax=Rhizobium sp. BK376 TaxID=2512149 RepID=UPI0010468306|nr:hypothetical protein [Rhizobium sp. BK376]TCR72214.1 hypothetical protein EV561_13039 [Rhizobium sp. BK376]